MNNATQILKNYLRNYNEYDDGSVSKYFKYKEDVYSLMVTDNDFIMINSVDSIFDFTVYFNDYEDRFLFMVDVDDDCQVCTWLQKKHLFGRKMFVSV